MRILLLFVCLSAVACTVTGEDVHSILNKVKKGTNAGKALTDVMSAANITMGFIMKFAKNVGPFLGAIGPVISLISTFLPSGPSAELAYMKRKFAEIDENFDKVFIRFGEVENLIRENSLKGQYGDHEQRIIALSDILQMYLAAPQEASESFKKKFIRNYESYYDSAALILYNGMVGSHSLSDDIPRTVMKYTNNHRNEFQKVITSIVNVILQGVKVQVAYWNMIGEDDTYIINDWEQKINYIGPIIDKLDKEIQSKWYTQLKNDIDEKLAKSKGESNSQFADELYSFLVAAHDWRDWHVLAYNPVKGYKKHMVKICDKGGYRRFRKYDRNLMVSSVDGSTPMLEKNGILNDIEYIVEKNAHARSF